MPSFADALAEVEQTAGRALLVDQIIDQLDAKDAAALVVALNGNLSSAKVSKALAAIGHTVGEGAINKWRERNGAR
jgi:hypothetical protein